MDSRQKYEKEKVLFAINTLNNGGAEKVLLTLLRYLDPKKYEIHLLVVFGEGIYFEQIPQYVRVTHIFPCKSKEATKEIRALPRSDAKSVHILAMSANAFESDIQECLKAGMDGHIAKPITMELLKEKLAK